MLQIASWDEPLRDIQTAMILVSVVYDWKTIIGVFLRILMTWDGFQQVKYKKTITCMIPLFSWNSCGMGWVDPGLVMRQSVPICTAYVWFLSKINWLFGWGLRPLSQKFRQKPTKTRFWLCYHHKVVLQQKCLSKIQSKYNIQSDPVGGSWHKGGIPLGIDRI